MVSMGDLLFLRGLKNKQVWGVKDDPAELQQDAVVMPRNPVSNKSCLYTLDDWWLMSWNPSIACLRS